jgi:ferredoxin-NADP reductase
MALLPWRKGKVIRIENETANTRRFWIEVPELSPFDFQPGQFITFDLPIHKKPHLRLRSYSISSWPDGSNVFELIIVQSQHGDGTNYIFSEVKVGSELTFRGPQGMFVLPKLLDKDLFLVCTGTGIAPFRSMVQHIKNKGIAHHNIYLVFGCRKKPDILYYDELVKLQNELENFRFIPTLSRQHWEGHHGYVHPIYEELCKTKPDAQFFLCGWKQMVDEAEQRILTMGYNKKVIHTELYG